MLVHIKDGKLNLNQIKLNQIEIKLNLNKVYPYIRTLVVFDRNKIMICIYMYIIILYDLYSLSILFIGFSH